MEHLGRDFHMISDSSMFDVSRSPQSPGDVPCAAARRGTTPPGTSGTLTSPTPAENPREAAARAAIYGEKLEREKRDGRKG